jgi:hypothetical protein
MSNTETDTNNIFKEIADAYIDVGNQHMDQHNVDLVGSSFVYGAARFSAFIVASGSSNLDQYKANRKTAIEHFTNQFKQMLEENLISYETVFNEEKKYEKYMKK